MMVEIGRHDRLILVCADSTQRRRWDGKLAVDFNVVQRRVDASRGAASVSGIRA